MYIFLDESGDLGFSKKSSKWFLFALVLVHEERTLERVVKKVWKTVHKKHAHVGELHASHEKDVTRNRMLRMLAEVEDLKIMTIILNKEKVHIDLQNQKNYLYNFTANIILDRLIHKNILDGENGISLIVDRKDTKKNLK